MLGKPCKTVRRARRLRRTMSFPEVAIWEQLRHRPSGLKFRRQHPAGIYVLDFYCAEARLCVEVDGEAHSRDAVLTLIVAEARARRPVHHPATPGGPPPQAELGEE